jgi:hypothetical protein
MKRALVAAVLLGAAAFGYRSFRGAGPEAQYRVFAEAMLQRKYDGAAAMTRGMTARDLAKLGTQERIGAGPQMFQTLFPSRFAIDAMQKNDDGSVTIHATQTVLFNPAGVESALRPAMYATMKQVVTLAKDEGGWKVTAFDNRFQAMDSTSGR